MHATCPTHLVLLLLVILMIKHVVKRANDEARHYAVFPNLLSLPPSQVQIFPQNFVLKTCPLYLLPIG